MPPTPEQEQIIREELIGVLATMRKDSSPQVTPVNYAYKDGKILISITKDRVKYHNVRRHPQVALCILRKEWRPYVTVYGRAEIEEDDVGAGTAEIARRMSDRPLPENFAEALREARRVLLVLTPERFVP